MEKIIAATDFSKAALNASKFAAAIAAEMKVCLLLVHVLERPVNPMPMPLGIGEINEIGQSATVQLSKLRDQLLFYTDNKIEIITELGYGSVENVLNFICDRDNPFALVLGIENESLRANFLGTTAFRILPNPHAPVLIIPENAVFSGINKIAIASSSEQVHENPAIHAIKNWLNAFQVSPDVFHVVTKKEEYVENISGNVFLYNQLKEWNPIFHSVKNENIEEGILGLVKEKKPDLLVVIPGKHNFFQQLIHASHSKMLVVKSGLPVLAAPVLNKNAKKQKEDNVHFDGHKACNGCDGLCCNNKNADKENRANTFITK